MENPYLISEVLEALCLKMKDNGLGHLVHPDAYTDRLFSGLYKTGEHWKLFAHAGVIGMLFGQDKAASKISEILVMRVDGEERKIFEMLAPLLGVKVTI